ncbi:IMS domain-containing protein [Synechococcus lacustris]|uniref:IMS domain-containing protein n=1 Tax=Synechococcus lacustris TaxID=2116544 RepID=UPI0020CE0F3F|nr:IMS domain-containing protein [Synechococcus lacustris]
MNQRKLRSRISIQRLELPLDHFRLLGVSPVVASDGVLRTLQQRLDRPPGPGFSSEALTARAELLEASANLLTDMDKRRHYECLLTEQTTEASTILPALEVPSNLEVGGLILLMESGQALEAFEGSRRALQPPQAPALGSSREADLALLAALACQQGGAERRRERHYETAALLLQQGIQLLQRMGQQLERRLALEADLQELLPYRVLDLLSRPLIEDQQRQLGQQLLQELISRRGGLDGEQDPNFSQEAFQSFFQQIRNFLTVQEQIDLFLTMAEAGSVTADFLSAYALTASGFAQRKPERIEAALVRLKTLHEVGVEPEIACLELLLGNTDSAQSHFQRGSDPELQHWAREQGDDPLAGVCAYCRDWLERQVLPCYRDLEADPDLEAYFADRDVQAYIERGDRRRAHGIDQRTEPITSFELLPNPSTAELEQIWQKEANELNDLIQPEQPREKFQLLEQIRDWWQSEPWEVPIAKLQNLSNINRWLVLGVAMVATSAIGLNLGRKQDPPPIPKEALLLPPPPVAINQPNLQPSLQPKPEPPVESPEQASKTVLEQWLKAKAEMLAGGNNAAVLSKLALPKLVDNVIADRAEYAKAGLTLKVTAQLDKFSSISSSPVRLEAQAQILYSEELLGPDGKLLKKQNPTPLTNTYVFVRNGANGPWQLADFRAGS